MELLGTSDTRRYRVEWLEGSDRLVGNSLPEGSNKVIQGKGWANAIERPRAPSEIYWGVAWCIYSFLFFPLLFYYQYTWFSFEWVRILVLVIIATYLLKGS